MKVTVTKNSPNLNKVGSSTMCGGVVLFMPEEDYDVYIGKDGACLVESGAYDVDQDLYAGSGDSITIEL